MLRGACRQVDPELFFPIAAKGPAEQQVADAKAVCGPCAVRPDCLSYALEALPEGIWGGTTREERRAGLSSSVRLSRLAAGSGPHLAVPHDEPAG
jgi:WhiB family redox-sensing transcriptional regulator